MVAEEEQRAVTQANFPQLSVDALVVDPTAVLAAQIFEVVAAGSPGDARVLAGDETVVEDGGVGPGGHPVCATPDEEIVAGDLQARPRGEGGRIGAADDQQHRTIPLLAGRERRLDRRQRSFGGIAHPRETNT